MGKRFRKQHWLVPLVHRAGKDPAGTLVAGPDVPPRLAWHAAAEASGVAQWELAALVARHFRLDTADLERAERLALRLVPGGLARRLGVLPLRELGDELAVATSDPTDFHAEQLIRFLSGRRVALEVAPPSEIAAAQDRGYGARGAGASTGAVDALGAGPPPSTGPVLVADDDPEDRLLARTLLERLTLEVHEVEDGSEVLDRLRTGPRYGLVVLDLEMPRLDGRGVLEALRSAPMPSGAVVVLTGSPDPRDEERLLAAGADDCVAKPIDPTRFTARVGAALRRASVL